MAPSKNFLKLIAELYRLEERGFRGQAAVHFDGLTVKDIVTTERRELDNVTIDADALTELKVIASKLSGA